MTDLERSAGEIPTIRIGRRLRARTAKLFDMLGWPHDTADSATGARTWLPVWDSRGQGDRNRVAT